MKYIAHINENGEEQTIKAHLEGTGKLAAEFAEAFDCGEWGYACGKLHDIGKYSDGFQKRIQADGQKVDHATAGAQLCWDMGGFYKFLAYCIAGHHAGLPDTGECTDLGTAGTIQGRVKKKIENYQAFAQEIEVPALSKPPFQPKKGDNPDLIMSVFIRMLYSCLVDADFLDTEYFMKGGECERDSGAPMEDLLEKLMSHISSWLTNEGDETVNGRRTEILKNCLEKGQMDRGLFRLTVPTGGGKTVASLAFALRHAVENKLDHIIYVIPYTSIIEQNAKVFSDILGRENVLEDHCNVNYDAGDKDRNKEEDEQLKALQLATENWDKPIIVTTNVQFFESLYGNKSTKCRKLHNIANSVVIFDEAQMLPNDYLKPCIAIMEQLVSYYRTSIVLCTATQPALQKLFSGDFNPIELCPRMEEQFDFFKRVTMKNLERISEDELVESLLHEKQALCILNTKKRVQNVYKRLAGEGAFHLSTAMYPVHRKRVLELIRKRLSAGEKCIVISTSLVEAGVDLDFCAVYRELAGIDSIIQAAGRCNREGKKAAESSVTYMFQLDENAYIPGQRQQIATTKALLDECPDISSLDSIQKYFEMLYHFQGESLDKKNILSQFKGGRFSFAKVGKEFKLIEENTMTIFVNKEERADNILKEIQKRGATKSLMREAGQYCINVYEGIFDRLNAAGMLQPVSEDLKEDFFVLRSLEEYTEEMGLSLDIEYGRAVMF